MIVFDINNIKKSSDGLFDLTTRTYTYKFNEISYSRYKVQKGEEMRMDLVCKSIYGNIDNIDIILNANNISNPLNIKEGTIIIYPNETSISLLRYQEVSKTKSKILANPDRSTSPDQDRQKYIDQNLSIPPNILEKPMSQVSIDGGLLKIGNTLFNR